MNANGWLKYGGSTIANYHLVKETCIVGQTNFAFLKKINNLSKSLQVITPTCNTWMEVESKVVSKTSSLDSKENGKPC